MLGYKLRNFLLQNVNILILFVKTRLHYSLNLLLSLVNLVRHLKPLNRPHNVEVSHILQLLGKLDHPQEVGIDRGTFFQLITIFGFENSSKGLTHDRNQHVQEHDLGEKCRHQEVNPSKVFGRVH